VKGNNHVQEVRRKTMATVRYSDGIVWDFSHDEVNQLILAENISTLFLGLATVATFIPGFPLDPIYTRIAIAGVAGTIAVHKEEFKAADSKATGVEMTLPWWAALFQLWGVLLMKPLPPAPPPPLSPDSGKPWTIVQPGV
jgi:hypothetical protein